MESKTITVDRARWDRIVAVVLAIEPTSDPIGWLETRDQLPTWIRDWATCVDVALERLQIGDLNPVSPPAPDAGLRTNVAKAIHRAEHEFECKTPVDPAAWDDLHESHHEEYLFIADAVLGLIREGKT